jgi:AhpD family alkylhydroperoxidase
VPATTLYLIEMRASQINGCSVCLDMHTRELKAAGESEGRISMVGAWREAPYFTDAERAALALTEAATRMGD